jgi:hypothetical protein
MRSPGTLSIAVSDASFPHRAIATQIINGPIFVHCTKHRLTVARMRNNP